MKRQQDINNEAGILDKGLMETLEEMTAETKKRQQVNDLKPEQGKAILKQLYYLIGIYEAEAQRLKSDIPHDGEITLIDAYNKGMLYEKLSFIDDLKLLIDESLKG